MALSNGPDIPLISSLNELEGQVVGWTFFAGRPLQENERSNTRNTIQLPEIHTVVRGKLEAIFHPEKWIGDAEEPEWERAEGMLLQRRIRQIWAPTRIRLGSILLRPGEGPESEGDGEIYRYEGIRDAGGGSHPENMFHKIQVRQFMEKPE